MMDSDSMLSIYFIVSKNNEIC